MERVHHPTASATAWDDPATRDAWSRLFTFAVTGQILWPVVCAGAFYAMLLIGQWSMWLLLPIALYGLYRTFLQREYIASAVQARRILRAYPWQMHRTPESGIGQIPGAKLGDVWLAFANPDQPERDVPVILHGHAGSVWWRRRLGRGYESEKTRQVAEVWFAGDPRFAGVIAVPGPRRLFLLLQFAAPQSGADGEKQASPEAVERARRAGVQVAP